MGNASLSALGGSEAIFLNPAALSWLREAPRDADKHTWGGQGVIAAGFADISGPAVSDNQSTFLIGGGITNGKHGLAAYYADLNLLTDDVAEIGLGYGVSFDRYWAVGGMLRILDRPAKQVQVTDFSIQHNWYLQNGKPVTATLVVRDPYGHTDDGMIVDLAASGYFSEQFQFVALAHDLMDKIFRTLSLGAEVEVRPGWFVRTGYEEHRRKQPVGLSLGVGHRVKDWQFDVAVTYWNPSMDDVDMGVGLTGGATVVF